MSENSQTSGENIVKLDKSAICKIINNYDELLNSINTQVEFYKNEHEVLRNEVWKVLEENEKLGSELKSYSSQSENSKSLANSNFKKLTTYIIKNLQRQIINLTEEKRSIEEGWEASKQTITNLETSIANLKSQYPKHQSLYEIKKEYTTAITTLETNVAEAREKLCEQQAINRQLTQFKAKQKLEFDQLNEKFIKLENEQKISIENLQKTEVLLVETKRRLNEMVKRKSEMEQYVQHTTAANREQTARESEALTKIHDALQVAESALQEKSDAILREQEMKEQCDFLTATINQVMENAAKKVESDILLVKEEYDSKIKDICVTVESLKKNLTTQTERAVIAEKKVKFLENELQNMVATNTRLDCDLHIASQTIIEMELKLEAFEKLMEREEATNRVCEERAKELQLFLKHNRILKEKWKETVEDITTKLQAQVKQLQQENFALKNENSNLKLCRNNIGIK